MTAAIFSLRHRKLPEFLQENRQTLLFLGLFGVGVLIGSILIHSGNPDVLAALKLSTRNLLEHSFAKGFGELFCDAFFHSFLTLFAVFLLGLSAVGLPLILFAPVFRGLGIGASLGFLYLEYGLEGAAYSLFVLLVPTVISVYILILSCKESAALSFHLFSCFFPEQKSGSLLSELTFLSKRYLFFMAITALSSLLESLLQLTAGQLFS